ncbi:copper resistance protein CopD [Halobellus sp. MBLA0160]|uniref:Copper resistance protein CopD n=1 Tax=Halobellus ruber TaxID=2761102 RepID=A0A7J9SHF3_9EURY|nr:copper resistance protein CopD [Halobellus ruber]
MLLSASYVVHVLSALLWIGAVLFVASLYLPASGANGEDLGWTLDRLLWITRWTGVALPVTGLYQVWLLYPLPRLIGTPRGHLVLGMFLLWGVLNGVVELGVYRARTVDGSRPSFGAYMSKGVGVDGGFPREDADEALAAVRPYLTGGAVLSVLLGVDAALLAGGLAAL